MKSDQIRNESGDVSSVAAAVAETDSEIRQKLLPIHVDEVVGEGVPVKDGRRIQNVVVRPAGGEHADGAGREKKDRDFEDRIEMIYASE